jgi:hypothetical protein
LNLPAASIRTVCKIVPSNSRSENPSKSILYVDLSRELKFRYYDAEHGTREALTGLSIPDTSEEIRARELEVVPTSIHTQQTKDRFSRDFAVPLNPRVG